MSTYSESGFDELCEEIESLLGDLYGVEAAAQAVLDYSYAPDGPAYDAAPKTNIAVSLPAETAFDVYPVLPTTEEFDYQDWIDSCFATGKQTAAGTGSWLKYQADDYHLVDAQAIISAAQQQSDMAHTQGVKVGENFREVSGNMFAHWEGEAQEAFGEWFAVAAAGVGALLFYADAAALSAGAAGDVIAATQNSMMRQLENGRDAIKDALATWREDADVFPHPPGSGYTLEQLNAWVSGHVDAYVDEIPGGGVILKLAVGQVVKRVPPVGAAIKGYNLLVALDKNDTDPQTPEDAATLSSGIEDGIKALAKDGKTAMDKLTHKITALAAEVEGADELVLPRLPRDPKGHYDPS